MFFFEKGNLKYQSKQIENIHNAEFHDIRLGFQKFGLKKNDDPILFFKQAINHYLKQKKQKIQK